MFANNACLYFCICVTFLKCETAAVAYWSEHLRREWDVMGLIPQARQTSVFKTCNSCFPFGAQDCEKSTTTGLPVSG